MSMVVQERDSLVILSHTADMLAEANTIQKAHELQSLALTAADWAPRKGMGDEVIQHCRQYALEAQRKMGDLLRENERAKPPSGKGQARGDRRLPEDTDGRTAFVPSVLQPFGVLSARPTMRLPRGGSRRKRILTASWNVPIPAGTRR